ncbi:MAG: PIN domain-containing protein [Candidatus Njordarchaeales archaeon]
MGVLIDTGIFFGFYSKNDIQHNNSVALIIHALQGKWGRPYISDHILDETINILKYKISEEIALEFIRAFIISKNVEVIVSDLKIIDKALELFKQEYKLKGFSLTDAISITLMQEFNIEYMLTFDRVLGKFVKIIGPNYIETLSKRELEMIKRYLK